MKLIAQNLTDRRNHFIDILKGICIIFVIISHFSWTAEERLKYLFPFWIDMAVPVFMIISGYVYSFSYKRNSINRLEDAYLMKNTLSKIVRYTVPFIITYSIEIAWGFYRGAYSNQGAASVIFGWGLGFLTGGYGPGSYYYPVMIQFIFVFPMIYLIMKKYNDKGLIICLFLNFLYELIQRAYGMNDVCYRLLMMRYILLIATGCFLAGEKYFFDKIKACFSLVIGIAFIIAYCYMNYEPKIIIYWTRTSFLACLYIIPIAMILISKLGSIRFDLLEICGRASYNIFLVQMVWYNYCSGFVGKYIPDRIVHLMINLIVCIGAGIIFYYIETPITKRLIRLFNQVIDRIS